MDQIADSSAPLIYQVILIIILTLINAFFAASEIAFVAMNHNVIEKEAMEGNKQALRVLKLLEDSDDFLSAIQIAITLAGMLNSASAASTIVRRLTPYLGGIRGAETVAIILVTLLIAYITLVFGELYPKSIALQSPEVTAKTTSMVIDIVQKLFKPIIRLLSSSTDLLKHMTPVDFTEKKQQMTRDEFRYFLEKSRTDKAIDSDEFSMLEGVLSLNHLIVREIMVPRTECFMLDYDDTKETNLNKLYSTQHSRVPIYDDDKDNIIGIIHIKQLFKASRHVDVGSIDLKDIMQMPLFVPETIHIDNALYEMQRTHHDIAMVTDEYGGIAGLITIEDIVEEIVGDFDYVDLAVALGITEINEKEYIIDGKMLLHDFNEFFKTAISSEAVDSIAGYFILETGYIPANDSIRKNKVDLLLNVENYLLTIDSIDYPRISSIKVERITER